MKDMKSLKPGPEVAKTRRAASRRLILLGLLAPLLLTAAASGQSAGPPGAPPVTGRPASGFHQKFRPEPAASGWPPANLNSPWAPASAFALQTNLRKYLDTWPTPGATATDDWPEYVGESDQELD